MAPLARRIEMSRVKQASQRSKAIPILGAAGLSLTLTSGVSVAAGSTPNVPARNAAVSQKMTLGDEEISDISLATFHVFDKESQTGKRLACGCGGGVACSPERHRPRSETISIRSNRIARLDGGTNTFRSIPKLPLCGNRTSPQTGRPSGLSKIVWHVCLPI
jgi:hypothetical protein